MAEPSDNEPFDLDRDELMTWWQDRFDRLLVEHPDRFWQQLALAKAFERWSLAFEQRVDLKEKVYQGFNIALLEIAALLRQGDFMPGGQMYHLVDPNSKTNDSPTVAASWDWLADLNARIDTKKFAQGEDDLPAPS
jgi:hypothetical protein